MTRLFLPKAYRETAILQTQNKKFFMTYSSEESTVFFTILYIYPGKGGKSTALSNWDEKKTQTQQLQLLTAFLRMQLLI